MVKRPPIQRLGADVARIPGYVASPNARGSRSAAVLCGFLLLLAVATVESATLDVCPASCTHATIESAVLVAAPGDTIDIGPGTYVEVVRVDIPNLTLVGAGAGVTIIDGPLSAIVVEATAGQATISDITLNSRVLGSCIRNHATLTVRDSVIENCYHESNGGGIYTDGDLILERVSILSSTASPAVTGHGRGGGLYVDGDPLGGGPVVRIYDSVFANNEALFGGGIYIGTGAVVFIDGTTFTGNLAGDPGGLHLYTGRGGAIRTFGELHLTNGTLFYNSADLYGGAIAVNASDATTRIANSAIFENHTGAETYLAGLPTSGGGIYVESGGDVKIFGTELYGNSAAYGGGIGVYNLLQQGTVTLVQSALTANHALEDGGGLRVYGGDVTVKSSTLTWNRADGYGGGAYGSAAAGMTRFRSSTVVGNVASQTGGGIHPVSMSLRNTVLAENSAAGGAPGSSGDDCDLTFDSGGHNLVGTADGCGSPNFQPSDLSGTDASPVAPLLQPPGDPDGSIEAGTYGHAAVPLPGSPAVDSAWRCPDLDQNGNRRPENGWLPILQCDRGAIELDAGCGRPATTTPIAPPDGGVGSSLEPVLSWEPKAGGASYDIALATQPPPFGASVVADVRGITATHWQPNAVLVSGQQYYWRVVSRSLCGASAQSPAFSFTAP